MEFWPENQGQSPLYSRFGTVPGRNCAHSYHETPQTSYYPLYYSGQHHQSRESSYWTLPGSRTGGAQQENSNWTDQDLTGLTSPQFPFILDRNSQQHQDLTEYQLQAARDREWTAGQRAARDYERGYLREGWQRRWEPCSPVHYNREVLSKRSDNSYRELEAWAARYSHSLPRRKRIEAELRGASQGLGQSRATERDNSRSGTDPRVAALQQVIQSANLRESTLWDRGARQQALTHYQCPTPAADTSNMVEVKDKTSNQRRMFSQPPGYIAPPPYNSPHKSSPLLQHCDTGLKQEGNGQTYRSQPTLREQDVSSDPLTYRKVDKDFMKPDGNQKIFHELKGTKEADGMPASLPDSIQATNIQHEGMSAEQKPQVLQEVQNKKTNEEMSSKVIEGRKFRLNKKTGGMTIFCLVSRIAGTSESPSLPLCTLQENTVNAESGNFCNDLSEGGDKLPDEVDFSAPALTDQSDTSDLRDFQAKQKETPAGEDSEILEDDLLKKLDADVCIERVETSVDSAFGKSVKYPLWREPSLTNRAESESSSTCSKVKEWEGESDVSPIQEDSVKVHPIDIEVRRLDITKASESEESNDLLVIDTTCVLVKMELIPSPKKEHVHYLHSMSHTEEEICSTSSLEDIQTNSQLSQDITTDLTNPLCLIDGLETNLDSDNVEEKEPETESEISFPCTLPSSVSELETLAERAERILGIPLQDSITQQELKGTIDDSYLENQKDDPSPTEDNTLNAVAPSQEDIKEDKQSQNKDEDDLTKDAISFQEKDEAKDQLAEGCDQEFAGPQEQLSFMPEEDEIYSELRDVKKSFEIEITEEPQLESASEEDTTEQNQKENQTVEEDTSSQHLAQNSFNSEENFVLPPETLSLIQTPSHQLQTRLLSDDLFPSPTPYTDNSCSTLDSIVQPAEEFSSGVWKQENDDEVSKLIKHEVGDTLDNLSKDLKEEEEPSESLKSSHPDDSSHFTESNVTDEQQTEDSYKDHSNPYEENAEVNILQQQFEYVHAKYSNEIYATEEQLPKDVLDQTNDHIIEETFETAEEHATDVNISQPTEGLQAEDIACATECFMNEKQRPKEDTQDLTGNLPKTIENAKDFQSRVSQMEIRNVPDIEHLAELPNSSPSSASDFKKTLSHLDMILPIELPSPPVVSNKADKEFVPPVGETSVCPPALYPEARASSVYDNPEIFPPPSHLDSCEESVELSSSLALPIALHPDSSAPPIQEGNRSGSPDLPLTEQPQYPRSLWDAVNRIRKHTAPDSENEEEEVSELWDPENAAEDLGCPEGAKNMKSKKISFDEQGQPVLTDGSTNEVQLEKIQPSPDTSGRAEEDTLSCSSTSSHNSGDTVIVADEDEANESLPHARNEIKGEDNEAFQKTEGELPCSSTDETATEHDNDGGETLENQTTLSEECQMQMENIPTNAVEIFNLSEVAISQEEVTESESVKKPDEH